MVLRTFLFIALLFVGVAFAALPNAPIYPTTTLSSSLTPTPSNSNPLTSGHWSETANLKGYRPPVASIISNPPQTDCPHSQSGLKNWHDASTWGGAGVPGNGANVNIPAGSSVLISTIDASHVYGLITIPATSKLIFADAAISIAARGFIVTGGLHAGSETCRLRNKITITLHGIRDAQVDNPWVKGIAVTGTIDLHGAQYYPTWTRLAMTAKPNDTWIFIQDIVNWQVGQSIVISTTELKDSRDWNRNEERVIVDVKRTTLGGGTVSAIQVNTPLSFQHFGGREYQAEVALLSRNIVVQGDATNSPPTDTANAVCKDIAKPGSTYPCVDKYLTGFGAHIIVYNETSQGRFSGVELFRVGQTNVLGRYPIHFHMMGNITSSNYNRAYARDCSVHDSYFRCYAIHGTQGVKLTENTAYNAIGHCYFLEDGVEEDNIISYNQAAHVHPLGYFMNPSNQEIKNADNFWGQYLEFYKETPTLILPSDMSGACFYITNTYNDIFGNAASGGWTGFAMPALPLPVKFFRHITNMSPANRPFRSPFRGNSAHSSGYWWQSAGSFYVGGELTHDEKGILTYTAGRSSTHDTCSDKTAGTPTTGAEAGCYTQGNQRWLRFEDNKVFLSNRGMQNWGNRAEIINLELHDVSLAMNVFGKVWIDNMLMECRTPNNKFTFFSGCTTAPPESNPNWSSCNIRDTTFFESFGGFQWYDVGQQHILTGSTFRNCRADWNRCAYGTSRSCRNVGVFTSLTHSDQFVPELMQVTSGITYENVSDLWRYSTAWASGVTVSGRLQSWYDPDGSASQTGSRTMIGSAWANDWWKYNTNCDYYKEAYRCKLAAGDSAASVILKKYDANEGQIGKTICMNGGGTCPVIGQVTHFGITNETAGLAIGVNAKLSGPLVAARGGWFIRYTTGTPKKLTAISVQVATEDIFLVAIPYPAGTTFTIYFKGASWCGTSWAHCRHEVNPVTSIAAVKAGFGDLYYWDNTNRLLYLRLITSKNTFGSPSSDNTARWTPYQPEEKFSRGGLTLLTPSYQSSLVIEASCSTDPCAPQNDVKPPNAIPITVSTTTTTTTAKATTATTVKATTTTAATTAKATTTSSSSSSTTKASTSTLNPSNGNNNGGSGGDVKDNSGALVVPLVVVLIAGAFLAL